MKKTYLVGQTLQLIIISIITIIAVTLSPRGRVTLTELRAIWTFYTLGALICYCSSPKAEHNWLLPAFTTAFSLRIIAANVVFIWNVSLEHDVPVEQLGVLFSDASYYLDRAFHLYHSNTTDWLELGFKQDLGYPLILSLLFHLFAPRQIIGVYFNSLLTSLTVLAVYKLSIITNQNPIVARRAATWTVLFPPFIFWGSTVNKDAGTIFIFPLLLCFCASLFLKKNSVSAAFGLTILLSCSWFFRQSLGILFVLIALATITVGFWNSRTADKNKFTTGMLLILICSAIVLMAIGTQMISEYSSLLLGHSGNIRGSYGTLSEGGVPIYRQLAGQQLDILSLRTWLIMPIMIGIQLYLPIGSQVLLDTLSPPVKLFYLAESAVWTFYLLPFAIAGLYLGWKKQIKLDIQLWLPALLMLTAIIFYSGADTGTVRWRATAMPVLLIIAAIGKGRQIYPIGTGVLAGTLLTNIMYFALRG